MIINRQYDRVIKIIKRKSLINKIIVLLLKILLYLRYEAIDNLQQKVNYCERNESLTRINLKITIKAFQCFGHFYRLEMNMFEANNFIVKCPSCNSPLPVLLIQVATQQLVTCTNCKNEFRLLDKDGKAKRGIAESYLIRN